MDTDWTDIEYEVRIVPLQGPIAYAQSLVLDLPTRLYRYVWDTIPDSVRFHGEGPG